MNGYIDYSHVCHVKRPLLSLVQLAALQSLPSGLPHL